MALHEATAGRLALSEISATIAWYNAQEAGLGSEFLDELRATFDELRASPAAAPRDGSASIEADLRRWRVRRFPYAVVFIETMEEYVIIAVMDLRRRPGYWMTRIDE
jgi:hypothetical protein